LIIKAWKSKKRLRLESEREFERELEKAERVEQVKQNILKIENYLKSASVNRPITENSQLTSSFSSVTSFISSIVISKVICLMTNILKFF
jgi:hypothetical protein